MEEENKVKLDPSFSEEKVSFDAITDKNVYSVIGENGQSVVEISGYNLAFKFNFDLIETLDDINEASAGIGELFKNLIIEQLAEQRKSTTKQQ